MEETYSPCFYRVSIKGIIRIDDKILLTKEHGSKRWDLPGGGIEHFEKLDAAFRREIREEINVEVIDLDVLHIQLWFTYDLDPGWSRPILYLVCSATIAPIPEFANFCSVDIGLFNKDIFQTILLEKHIEKFRPNLIKLAFESLQ